MIFHVVNGVTNRVTAETEFPLAVTNDFEHTASHTVVYARRWWRAVDRLHDFPLHRAAAEARELEAGHGGAADRESVTSCLWD